MANKNILLIEPGYNNKYPPLGLMKIAAYHGPDGKNDNITFIKGEDKSVLNKAWDRIYITTLFSFEWKKIEKTIDFALQVANDQADRIFVGGIAASLMHKKFLNEHKWSGIRFINGLLNKAPAKSLQLDDFSEEFYSDDITSTPIEQLIPDYNILEQIEYEYPVRDAYFVYASRGCVRKCSFCGVPKLEGDFWDTDSITNIVKGIENKYGAKKDLIFMDNNVVASPKFKEIMAEIRDLGFQKDAKLNRNNRSMQRRVDFNQGVDARILCKSKMYLQELSTICIKPLRIAFDHLGLRKPYERAIRYAHEFGLDELSNYMLYNFHDSPSDLYERMLLNVKLNEDLGIRIYSFPMRYQPTDRPDRGFVGEKWSKYALRSMQVILQATHGIVSGSPDFFYRAFGGSGEIFEELLTRPHHFIFNREWYEKGGGKSEFEDYQIQMKKLSNLEKEELNLELSKTTAGNFHGLKFSNQKLQSILSFYVPLSDEEEQEIWVQKQKVSKINFEEEIYIPDDEKVEDAGYNDVIFKSFQDMKNNSETIPAL
jgi:hypothetical protein